jgi:hypothetical protein
MVKDTQVRVQMEGRGFILRCKEGLRRIHRYKVRQHGNGDGDEGINLQRVHQGDGVGPKRRPAMTMLVTDSCNRAESCKEIGLQRNLLGFYCG